MEPGPVPPKLEVSVHFIFLLFVYKDYAWHARLAKGVWSKSDLGYMWTVS